MTNGISVVGLLGIAFIVLKLCGVIGWSWWLVTLPFWGGLVLFVAVIVAICIFCLIAAGLAKLFT